MTNSERILQMMKAGCRRRDCRYCPFFWDFCIFADDRISKPVKLSAIQEVIRRAITESVLEEDRKRD